MGCGEDTASVVHQHRARHRPNASLRERPTAGKSRPWTRCSKQWRPRLDAEPSHMDLDSDEYAAEPGLLRTYGLGAQ